MLLTHVVSLLSGFSYDVSGKEKLLHTVESISRNYQEFDCWTEEQFFTNGQDPVISKVNADLWGDLQLPIWCPDFYF